MSTASALPRWDVSTVFPSLESPEFAAGFTAAVTRVDELTALFDESGVGRLELSPAVDGALVAAVERVINAMNETLAAYRTLSSYIYSYVVTDSHDTTAQARQSEAQRQSVRLAQLRVRFTAWVGSLDVEALDHALHTGARARLHTARSAHARRAFHDAKRGGAGRRIE